jgi:hypothetical protein
VSLRILNRGVALAGVALHFDDRALTAERYVLEGRAEIGAAWLLDKLVVQANVGGDKKVLALEFSTAGGLKKSHPNSL